ncbi:bifunctional metallophosphatase/5'-nucleotidase [Tenuibacillus multivorans]|uniref:2',3'-cyclic-nucleotide 2'-phosphodiesterase/5'-or 3'-nucleotidase, 5'-nucleotidase family n=1 Tax=Tenuibacillus multivorans TaxID=237069 RepID=A0A1H0FUV1_9BACI|nr:bifunctional UDP-sugar hydrolase/5'-nucleotidase [Tenuibacillus multivorans]GEL77869.1 putative metallophosphoesterase YunD [Tenuibacillus multivorans]SDN98351.1 2',3'-cyclic-nucleotide 2'-phosphodiesterase/5'-or 3'-nucleotidase, 5'-nucleotidase family [Tenuibacillus multivorans]
MNETLHFYFTSDLHSHFENWPKIMHAINQRINKHQSNDEFYMLLDNGDHMDRSHPITEASLGDSNITLLNHADFRVGTLGNNEGITLPAEKLYHLYDQADFDIVCANISIKNKNNPDWLNPYQIYQTPSGIKIGIIGLTAPFEVFYEKLGWETHHPLEKLRQYLPEVREQSDMVIVLSHLGVTQDEAIASEYDVDVIMGGHTHHLFKQAQNQNHSLINAVGKHGHYFGEIMLEFNHTTKRVEKKEGYAIPVEAEGEDENTNQLLKELEQQANDELSQVVADLDQPYPIDWLRESKLMKAFVQTLQDWTDADCAMLNAGVLLKGFDQGLVTRGEIHESCPHPMNPCTMVLTGNELLEMVRMLEKEQFINFELKGLGFRGKKIGKMVYSNIEIKYHDDTEFVETIFVNGEKINPDHRYTVATADTFSFPWLVPPISSVKEKQYFLPEFLRDLLEKCLSNIEN